MTNIKDGQPISVADLMNPRNKHNKLDASGGVDWQPKDVLAMTEMSLPSEIIKIKPGDKK